MSLLLAGLLALSGAAADGKGKHKKKHKAKPPAATIAGPQQHQILESGQITVTVAATRRRSLEVHALAGGTDLGPVTGASAAPASGSLSLPLTDAGRSVLSDCNADALAASVSAKKKKKKKKKHKKKNRKAAASILAASTALDRDLAICSVGSENPTARPYYGPPIPTANADRCDFLDPTVCMQPFPNDYFTKSDPSTATDRRLNFQAASMPHNKFGTAIDPTDFNHADGFSPGNAIIIKIPQVETQAAFNNSGLVRQSDPHRYLDPGQPAVVINTDTGQRQPIFAELDAQPNNYTPGNTHDVDLIIRPLKNLDEGGHFVVGLRSLKDASGQSVPPPMPFRVYRDRLITGQPEVESRRPHIETTISQLQSAGIPRANLYTAWDFTVASETSLAGRALALRDNALSRTG
ncbi:MAG: hypothetical protein ACXWW8_07750, partial [Solirubrobacterales bacterium]